jgi:hypothetical protein
VRDEGAVAPCCSAPGGEVVVALGNQLERNVLAEAVDQHQVLAEQQRRANIELRAVRLSAGVPTL